MKIEDQKGQNNFDSLYSKEIYIPQKSSNEENLSKGIKTSINKEKQTTDIYFQISSSKSETIIKDEPKTTLNTKPNTPTIEKKDSQIKMNNEVKKVDNTDFENLFSSNKVDSQSKK